MEQGSQWRVGGGGAGEDEGEGGWGGGLGRPLSRVFEGMGEKERAKKKGTAHHSSDSFAHAGAPARAASPHTPRTTMSASLTKDAAVRARVEAM